MPTFEQIQSRTTGQPRQPSVAGGPPTPSMPNTTVTPPAPAASTIGRPPVPFAGGQGAALPTTGAAKPPLPGAKIQQAPAVQAQGGNVQSGQQGNAGQQPGGFSVAMSRVPSRAELATMPPGTVVTTPYGEVSQDGNLIPSPEGVAAYQQAIVAKRRSFGVHPFSHDPSAPPPPIKLGRPSFNPFTGTWVEA